MTRATKTLLILSVALAVAMVSSLFVGPVHIPAHSIVDILLGREASNSSEAWRFIVLQTRLPQTLTAVLCGAALSVCGLLLQNIFRNPLADSLSLRHQQWRRLRCGRSHVADGGQ